MFRPTTFRPGNVSTRTFRLQHVSTDNISTGTFRPVTFRPGRETTQSDLSLRQLGFETTQSTRNFETTRSHLIVRQLRSEERFCILYCKCDFGVTHVTFALQLHVGYCQCDSGIANAILALQLWVLHRTFNFRITHYKSEFCIANAPLALQIWCCVTCTTLALQLRSWYYRCKSSITNDFAFCLANTAVTLHMSRWHCKSNFWHCECDSGIVHATLPLQLWVSHWDCKSTILL